MRGQPEPGLDIGIGRRVEVETVPTEPEWRAIPGKPHHYEHTSQRNADGTPVKRYAPPVPDCPQHVTPWDIWREYLRKQNQDVDFQIFFCNCPPLTSEQELILEEWFSRDEQG